MKSIGYAGRRIRRPLFLLRLEVHSVGSIVVVGKVRHSRQAYPICIQVMLCL